MTTDRDEQPLDDPALKIAPGMLEAFGIAEEIAADRKNVSVRIIDADVLLEIARAMTTPGVPKPLMRKAPRNEVEVFIDPSGVMVVGTGPDSRVPVYRATLPLPLPDAPVSSHAFDAALGFHVKWAERAVGAHAARGLHGTTP